MRGRFLSLVFLRCSGERRGDPGHMIWTRGGAQDGLSARYLLLGKEALGRVKCKYRL